MKKPGFRIINLLFACFCVANTHAAVVSVTGEIQQVSSITATNPNIQLQTEIQDLLLPLGGPGSPPPLNVETLVVPGVTYTTLFQGTSGQFTSTPTTSVTVNSYLLHFENSNGFLAAGTITFDGPILGVNASGPSIQDSDIYFGITPTYFNRIIGIPVQFGDTGIGGPNPNYFSVSADLRTLDVALYAANNVAQQGVEIRVITQSVSTVPVPAAVWFFGSGLLGLIGIFRRKKTM